jgi:hypothetical protein
MMTIFAHFVRVLAERIAAIFLTACAIAWKTQPAAARIGYG